MPMHGTRIGSSPELLGPRNIRLESQAVATLKWRFQSNLLQADLHASVEFSIERQYKIFISEDAPLHAV